MSVFSWTMKHYDKSSNDVTSQDWRTPATVDNVIRYASNRMVDFPLQGIDRLEFDLNLFDPMALAIQKKSSFIKLWRNITDTAHSKTYASPAATPDFVGVVNAVQKIGSSANMHVTVQGILWRLQCHFHVANHHLVLDVAPADPHLVGSNQDGLAFDQSALMFRLIALINEAFYGLGGYTGIVRPVSGPPYWPKTVNIAPYFVAKGSNTWSNIYDDLLQRISAAELVPTYIHVSASPDMMYFNTAVKRGSDKSATTKFEYHYGAHNLLDLQSTEVVNPGSYANYVWVVGDGGPNVYAALGGNGDPTLATAAAADMAAYGIYMKVVDQSGTKIPAELDAAADDELRVALRADRPSYVCTLTPAVPLYYGIDFGVGDVVGVNAQKGALLVGTPSSLGRPAKQRIYDVQLNMSDNNMETPVVQLSDDFTGKVATTP